MGSDELMGSDVGIWGFPVGEILELRKRSKPQLRPNNI
jgi:hypothetical protein